MFRVKSLYFVANQFPMRIWFCLIALLGFLNLPAQLEFAGGPFGASILHMAQGDSATYVTTLRGVYRTRDNGETWLKLIEIPISTNLYSDQPFGFTNDWPLAARDSQVIVWYYGDGKTHLRYSRDFGTTWKVPVLPQYKGNVIKGEFVTGDSLIYMYKDSLLFYSINKKFWNLKILPESIRGVQYDRDQWYYWTTDSIYKCIEFPDSWVSYPMEIPDLITPTLRIEKGILFAISDEPWPAPNSFWVAPCFGCGFEEKPELKGIESFDVSVVGDSVFLWPKVWPGKSIWLADLDVDEFVRDSLRTTPFAYPGLTWGDATLETDGEALFITTSNRFGYPEQDEPRNSKALMRSDDNGFTWAVKEEGIDEPWINGTLMDSAGLYVCTGNGLFFQPAGTDSWNVLGPKEWYTESVAWFDGKLWRVSSGPIGIHVYQSDGQGFTWNMDMMNASGVLTATSEALFLKEMFGTVYRKKTGESNWVDITSSLPISNSNFHLIKHQESVICYLGDDVYRSFDAGDSWDKISLPTTWWDHPNRLISIQDTLYYIGTFSIQNDTDQYRIYRWQESNSSWDLVSNSLFLSDENEFDISSRKISGLAIQENQWFLGIRGKGIYTSPDAGGTWTSLDPEDVCISTYSLGIVDGWFYNVSQLFGAWRMELQTSACCAESDELIVQVTPNPTTGQVRISGPEIIHCTVYDAFGRVVLDQAILNGTLELSGLLSGTYFIRLMDHRGRSVVRPIVKL